MKSKYIYFPIIFSLLLYCCAESGQEISSEEHLQENREYYQLKTYTFDSEEQQGMTDNFLEGAFLPALKRLGISNIGVFKTREGSEDTLIRTFVLIPFSSLGAFQELKGRLQLDQDYLEAGKAYHDAAYDNPPYSRIESVLLEAFVEMPEMATPDLNGPREDRIYELRSYESSTEKIFQNKVDMFNAGGEVILFDKLGFNAVFYGEVISGPKMPNLMYMTTFSDQASRDAHWKTFVDSPEWKEMSALEKYQNNVSHIDIYFLYPTEYSDY